MSCDKYPDPVTDTRAFKQKVDSIMVREYEEYKKAKLEAIERSRQNKILDDKKS